MTALTASLAAQPIRRPRPVAADYQISPALRTLISMVAVGSTGACTLALTRYAAGYAPMHPGLRHLAVIVHLSAVLPAVPLGAWLMLSRKGTPRHKQLGKLWVLLMVLTAISALFIRGLSGGGFSPIHLFVPLTFHGAYKAISTARRGDIAGHKKGLTSLYLGALVIPGLFAFLPGRVMGLGLFG